MASYKVGFGLSLLAALTNGVFGVGAAWVLARYRFPGCKILDAMTDLPFALPTAVAGNALTALYAPNEWIGQFFTPLGVKISFTQLGIYLALTFLGLPFVVRTVQPVIQDLSADVEEAAACLGANRFQTFRRVVLPALFPSILTGITPLLTITKLVQYDYAGAAGLGFVMLLASFVIVLLSNGLQSWDSRRRGAA